MANICMTYLVTASHNLTPLSLRTSVAGVDDH